MILKHLVITPLCDTRSFYKKRIYKKHEAEIKLKVRSIQETQAG